MSRRGSSTGRPPAGASTRYWRGQSPSSSADGCFYPWSGRLVHVLPEPLHRELRLDRNKYKITAVEQARLLSLRVVPVLDRGALGKLGEALAELDQVRVLSPDFHRSCSPRSGGVARMRSRPGTA